MRENLKGSASGSFLAFRMSNYAREEDPAEYFQRYDNWFQRADITVNAKSADGYRSPSSYYARDSRIVGTGDYYSPPVFDRKGRGWEYEGMAAFSLPRPDINAYASHNNVNYLRTRILNNIKDEVLDVAMLLAELQESTSLVTNNLMRVARSMDAVRRRKPESFSYLMHGRRRDGRRPTDKFLRETAGTFLEWKYGIMPVMYDIEGLSKGLDMANDGSLFDNPPLLVARAGLPPTVEETSHKPVSTYVDIQPVTCRTRYQASARCDFSVSGEGLRGLSRYGIGLGTVGTLLFERTPFSFVLNMAFPLAELIKAWTSISSGVNVRGYSETFYAERELVDTVAETVRPIGRMSNLSASKAVVFERRASGTVPMPLPFVRNPIKTGNLASVLALFTQLRKSS